MSCSYIQLYLTVSMQAQSVTRMLLVCSLPYLKWYPRKYVAPTVHFTCEFPFHTLYDYSYWLRMTDQHFIFCSCSCSFCWHSWFCYCISLQLYAYMWVCPLSCMLIDPLAPCMCTMVLQTPLSAFATCLVKSVLCLSAICSPILIWHATKRFSDLPKDHSTSSAPVIQHPEHPDTPVYRMKGLWLAPSLLLPAALVLMTRTNMCAVSQVAMPCSEPIPAEHMLMPADVTCFLHLLLQSAKVFLSKNINMVMIMVWGCAAGYSAQGCTSV